MFWYTKDELVELYENEFGKNYYGKDYIKCPVMILRKSESMLPYELTKDGYYSGGTMDAYFNREEIYFKNQIGKLVMRVKFDTSLGREIINCLAFIDKNPNEDFYTLLVYPDTLSFAVSSMIGKFEEVGKFDLSAEDIGLEDMAVKVSLVRATIIAKKKFFYAFSTLNRDVNGGDSRMMIILPNIEPSEYDFYYR